MKQSCARCGVEFEPGAVEARGDPVVSHGLCQRCSLNMLAQHGMPLMDYLDGLGAPVAVVDEDGTVMAGNRQLSELVKQDLASISGKKGGDVFECEYAGLPEGCGRTIHCSACSVRNSVMETLRTGRSQDRIRASLQAGTPGESRRVDLLISTERVGSHALLRIDMMDGRQLVE